MQDEEVNHQFQDVRHVTNTSHVEEYGDIDLGITKMSEVIGYSKVPSEKYTFSVNVSITSHQVMKKPGRHAGWVEANFLYVLFILLKIHCRKQKGYQLRVSYGQMFQV